MNGCGISARRRETSDQRDRRGPALFVVVDVLRSSFPVRTSPLPARTMALPVHTSPLPVRATPLPGPHNVFPGPHIAFPGPHIASPGPHNASPRSVQRLARSAQRLSRSAHRLSRSAHRLRRSSPQSLLSGYAASLRQLRASGVGEVPHADEVASRPSGLVETPGLFQRLREADERGGAPVRRTCGPGCLGEDALRWRDGTKAMKLNLPFEVRRSTCFVLVRRSSFVVRGSVRRSSTSSDERRT